MLSFLRENWITLPLCHCADWLRRSDKWPVLVTLEPELILDQTPMTSGEQHYSLKAH